MHILQVNSYDIGGGAERIAQYLHRGIQERGHASHFAVGTKLGDEHDVLPIPNDAGRNVWERGWSAAGASLLRHHMGGAAVAYRVATVGNPRRFGDYVKGVEDFNFPATRHLLDLSPQQPDLLHLHNLHGNYFDLRALADLSRHVPIVITLHDAWMLSGHCAHSFDCERWRTGCGQCPDLHIYPPVRHDSTAYNWRRKRDIYAGSQLYVATPCQWLMNKAQQSMLQPAMVQARVIPNGVDCQIFHPADQQLARQALGIPPDARVCLFVGHGVRKNPWKDYAMIEAAIHACNEREILCLCLGEKGETRRTGRATIRFIEPRSNVHEVARYYQAADLYLHAARTDTFPTVVLEALACGTPVIATSVGGIPEQIDEGRTGFLVPLGDTVAMAARIGQVLDDDGLRRQMSEAAVDSVQRHFTVRRMVDDYIDWYAEILQARGMH